MPDLNVSGKNIISRLGIIKNELLIFIVLICLILNASAAYGLDNSADPTQKHGGLLMHYASVVIVLFGIGFYIYAYLNLPSSTQELAFVNEARKISKEHKIRRPKPDKTPKTPS